MGYQGIEFHDTDPVPPRRANLTQAFSAGRATTSWLPEAMILRRHCSVTPSSAITTATSPSSHSSAQTLASELAAVSQHNRFVGSPHHGLLGFNDQQIGVEKPPVADTGYTQEGLVHVELGEHFPGVGTQQHPRTGMHVTADQDHVRGTFWT